MALALTGFLLTTTWQGNDDIDEISYTRQKEYGIMASGANDAEKRTNALAEVSALITALDVVVGADLIGYRFTEVWASDSVPSSVANVYKEANLELNLNPSGTKHGNLTFVAPIDTAVVGGRPDASNANIVALVARFQSPNFATISDGEQARATSPVAGTAITFIAKKKR